MLALEDTEQSWNETKVELQRYSLAAGQLLNVTKTETVLAGSLRRSNPPLPTEWKVCPEGGYVISLGVPIGNDFNEEEFWTNKYFKCKSLLANWKHLFVHSTRGRVLISQSSVYSRFRYWLYSMMPSEKVDEYIRSDMRHLLWASHPEFNAREGGTKGPCLRPPLHT